KKSLRRPRPPWSEPSRQWSIGRHSSVWAGGPHGILRRRQIVQVTGCELSVLNRSQFGLLDTTAVEGVGAAGVKTAAFGPVDRARHVAFENNTLACRSRFRHRHGGEQRLSIGMLAGAEDLPLAS